MKEDKDFGDFEEVNVEAGASSGEGSEGPIRVRIPRGNEIPGVISQRLGGNRMEVRCSDGKTRNCRVPGRFKRTLWLRLKDVVLIVPWEFDNEKGDVIFKYTPGAANQLKAKGILKNVDDGF